MSLKLSRRIQNINYLIDSKDELLWIDDQWDNYAFRNYIRNLDKDFRDGNIFYDKRNMLTEISANQDLGIQQNIAIKKFKLTRNYDKLRFRLLKSKAVRSLKIALALEEVKLNTPKPVAVIEERGSFNKIIYSYFVTEYVDYDYNLLDIIKDKRHPLRAQVKDWLPQIAEDIKRMHDAGIVHNDLHAGNILLRNIDTSPKFYYIDLNRGRIKKSVNTKTRVKDLVRFKLSSEEQKIFIRNYDPSNYQNLLNLMIRLRDRRRKFIDYKKKLRSIFKKNKN